MILKSITLQNIRSYKEQKIEFPTGTLLFEGDIGSGKSTILMAIEFALFGLGSQRGNSLLKLGQDKGFVALEFSIDGVDYEVKRNLTRKKNSINQTEGEIITPQGTILLSPGELKERIMDLLNFKEPSNPKAQSVVYRYAIFTPQEEMKTILTQKPTDRVQTLRKAFGIEDYKTASDNAILLAKDINDEIIKLTERTSDLSGKKTELKEKENTIQDLLIKEEQKSKEKERLENLITKDEKELEKLRDKERKYHNAKSNLPLISGQISEKLGLVKKYQKDQSDLQNEIDEELKPGISKLKKIKKPTNKTKEEINKIIKNCKEYEKRQNNLLGKRPEIELNIKKLRKSLGNYADKSIKEITSELGEIEQNITKHNKKLLEVKKALKDVVNQKSKLEVQQSEIEKNVIDLSGIKGVCPVCEQVLSLSHKQHIQKERTSKLNEIKKRLPELVKKESELDEDKEKIEKLLEQLRKTSDKLVGFQDTIRDLQEQEKKLTEIIAQFEDVKQFLKIPKEKQFDVSSDYENISDYFTDVREALDQYNSASDSIKKLEQNITKNTTKIKNLTEEIQEETKIIEKLNKDKQNFLSIIDELNDVPTEIDKLNQTVEQNGDEITQIEKEIGESMGQRNALNTIISNLKTEINKKESERHVLQRLQNYYSWIKDFFVPTIQVIEQQVMFSIKEEFETDFKKWYNMILEDPNKDARIDEDFSPIIEQDGFEQEVENLSSGERTSIALAYRLALNRLVQKVSTGMRSNLLILDEPTDGFSKSQLFKVREVLRELNAPQVVIVSHEVELEGFADKIFQVTKDNRGLSSIIVK